MFLQKLSEIMLSVYKISFQPILATIIIFVFLWLLLFSYYNCICIDLYDLQIWMVLKFKLLFSKNLYNIFFIKNNYGI